MARSLLLVMLAVCLVVFATAKAPAAEAGCEWNGIEDDGNEEEEMEPLARDFMETNPEVVNGLPVFEADILLTPEQWSSFTARKGLAATSKRWPEGSDGNPLVPYIFADSRYTADSKAKIVAGMNHWMEHTCIKFEETTNTNQPHLRYIKGGGCFSHLGKLRKNGQNISIDKNCESLGTVVHEVGHAIGFEHEQSRPDRDDYVRVNLENIADKNKKIFNKASTSSINDQNIEYDYSSVMQYRSTAFSKNGKTTIATLDPLAQPLLGKRAGLSHRDKQLANVMYGCIGKWLQSCGTTADPCQNGGYYGKGCKCVCPPGTSGTNCETKTGGYYDALKSPYTEVITAAGNVTSPNYPGSYPKGGCVKLIQAPECHVPKLTFSTFELFGRKKYCYVDALEIRTKNRFFGDVFCGKDISAGQSFTSSSRDLILFFRSATSWKMPGFSAQLTFVLQDGCP